MKTGRAIVIMMVLLLSGCAEKINLLTGLDEREAVAVLSELYREKIAAEKITDRSGLITITVPSKDVARATILLHDHGLPHQRLEGIDTLFKKEGMISSQSEERIRFYFGLSQEISKTLSQIDGVISSRVHLIMPDIGDSKGATPTGAAVMIRHIGEFQGDVNKIRELIANSVPGLSTDRVMLYLFEVGVPAGDHGSPIAAEKEQSSIWIYTAALTGLIIVAVSALIIFLPRYVPSISTQRLRRLINGRPREE